VEATKGLDQAKLAAYMHEATFNTVVGKVKFGKNGEWAESRVLEVQFRDVQPDNMEQFAGPGKRVVLYPTELQSGQMIYPYGQ
jgi:branched-chain amino acid transport system substrate-binding protein